MVNGSLSDKRLDVYLNPEAHLFNCTLNYSYYVISLKHQMKYIFIDTLNMNHFYMNDGKTSYLNLKSIISQLKRSFNDSFYRNQYDCGKKVN